MSDKPLVQQALADELAELVLMITTTSQSLAFLRGFWETMVREWSGIDRLRYVFTASWKVDNLIFHSRIDKYYMLVRRYINASFKLLSRAGWDKASCEEYNDILTHEGGPLWYNLRLVSLYIQFPNATLVRQISVYPPAWRTTLQISTLRSWTRSWPPRGNRCLHLSIHCSPRSSTLPP